MQPYPFIYMITGIVSQKNYCERNPRKKRVFVKEDGKIGLNSLQCSHNCRLASCFGHVDFCVVDETCCRREGCSVLTPLGKGGATKSDEFSEKFQTAFDPPLIFGKLYCNFFSENVRKKPLIKFKNCSTSFLD